MRLQNKTAIITGGSAGIGAATTATFVREGAHVIIWDVDEQRGREMEEKHDNVQFQHVDVTDRSSIAQALAAARAQHPRIDILINNAGITRDATLVKMEEPSWDAVIDINLKGVFNCAQAVAPEMVAQESGVILNAASVVGLYGNFGQSNYVASKAGVIGLTKVWARELGPKGVRVNAVAPGFIATDMVGTIPEKVIAAIRAKTPLARLGEARDIANAYLFLASDEAAFINGTTLSVDGGLVA